MTADVHYLNAKGSTGAVKGLLQSLVPRATCFCFYDKQGTCVWSSDGADDHEIDAFAGDLPLEVLEEAADDAGSIRRTLGSGRTLLALPVRTEDRQVLGVLIAVFSKNDGKSSWFNPSLLTEILTPAVGVVAELLTMDQQLEGARGELSVVDDELRLVYSIDKKLHGPSRRHSGLAELIGQSGRFLGIAYSVLLIPGKRIRISATHSTWKSVNRRAVDKYVVETLFGELDGGAGPVVFDIAPIEGSEHPTDQGHQALISPILDSKGNTEGAIAQFGRVSGRPFVDSHRRFMAHIARKVEYVIDQSFDPMTGLMNRAGFEAQLHESAKTLTDGGDAHQIVYFDLDNLQLVNDTFGRDAGDQVLMRFAQVLEDCLPRNAVATRLTADDFAILITHASLDDALDVANSVRSHGDKLRYLRGTKSLQVTVSAGIAAFDLRVDDADALTAARIACEAAKDHGRDRVEVHDHDDQSIIRRYDDMQLITRVQSALDQDEFALFAQPIVSAQNPAQCQSYEILLRMKDAKGNPIASSSLISAAERYHLMPPVDRWVISNTLRKLGPCAEALKECGVGFAINLSGQSIGDSEMLAFIEAELDAGSVPAELLSFEITESAAVSRIHRAQTFIAKLRERGCRFSLDDFGAGLSSFSYLKNLDVDTLKIDGHFIRDIVDDKISQSMVAAITEVAKVMGLDTIAEYVETADIQKQLKSLGVQYLQGHSVGKPVELDEILEQVLARKTA